MFLGLHLLAREDLFDDALFIDDEGRADGTHRLFAVNSLTFVDKDYDVIYY